MNYIFRASVAMFCNYLFATLLHNFFVYLCKVKLVYLLLAIYVTVLTVLPCSDPDTCQDEIQNGGQVANVSDHEHSDNEQGVCTPFCICSCCAAHIRLSSASDIDFAGVIHNTKQTIPYLEKLVLSDHNHIWQPPRI